MRHVTKYATIRGVFQHEDLRCPLDNNDLNQVEPAVIALSRGTSHGNVPKDHRKKVQYGRRVSVRVFDYFLPKSACLVGAGGFRTVSLHYNST